jgi:hypothetical protein
MQEEIQAHRYSDLPELARMADGVASLLRRATPNDPAHPATARFTPSIKPDARAHLSRRAAAAKKYPRFERDDDARLIKVGWSKKAREEYEHRTPREAVAAFVSYLVSKVKVGSTFVVEDLAPVPDSTGGEIPAYQVYMTLAWLRDLGLVQKKGRDGYVLRDSRIDGDAFNELWEHVPNRS